ncbi:MAG: sulfatase-like hydrolase/transferase [Pirellulales bacterium]|nr:sulfatase-like hydrolase/transferase [Pirellulales bacterium]
MRSTQVAGLRTAFAGLWTPGLSMAVAVAAGLMTWFQVHRAGLLAANWPLAQLSTWNDLAAAFAVGLRFDLATTAYAMTPLIVAAGLAHRARGPRVERGVYAVGLFLYIAAFAFLGIAEIGFFDEFHTRFNSLALQYWSQPGTVLSMIWYGFPVIRYLCLLGVFLGVVAWVIRWLARRVMPDDLPPAQLHGPQQAIQAALLVVVLVMSARGGVRGTPLNWGDSVLSNSMFVNQLTLNGVWCLGRTVISRGRHDQLEQLWRKPLTKNAAIDRTRAMLCLPGESIAVDDERFPLLRNFQPTAANATTGPRKQMNVVVVLMESFSARFVGAVGSDEDYTPEFNRLARQGILYDRCFSVGTHTHQANFAVFGGFPNLPGYESLMENEREGSQPLESLPRTLKRLGYDTHYCYNGDLAWENLRGFFRTQGVEHFVERNNFSAESSFDHTWGVRDYDLFRRVDLELSRAKQPFCASVLTISNHTPFDLPNPLPFPPVTDQGAMNQRLNGIRYADWALGEFFRHASQRPWFRDTLFVLVGDHGFSIAPMLTELRLLRFHVPLLFYGPGVLKTEGKRIHSVVSQLDIIPTLLALIDPERPHQSWGRNLFAVPDDDPGLAVFKPSENAPDAGLARGDLLFVRTADGRDRLYRYSLAFPPQADLVQDNPQQTREMDADLHAFLQTATRVLRERTAAAPEEVIARLKHDQPTPAPVLAN